MRIRSGIPFTFTRRKSAVRKNRSGVSDLFILENNMTGKSKKVRKAWNLGIKINPVKRFKIYLQKVTKTDRGCWEWVGANRGNGYGAFYNGIRTIGSHRYSWEECMEYQEPQLLPL